MSEVGKAIVFGIFIGGGVVYWFMQERPGTPYEVCTRYWGQKYYSEGDYPIVAARKAEGHCESEKTDYDGDYTN